MKGDRTLRPLPVECQGEEELRRHPGMGKLVEVPETEFPVVIRMPDQAAAPRTDRRQPRQAFPYQRLDDELLGVLADSERPERGEGDGGDGVGIAVGFVADDDSAVHLTCIRAELLAVGAGATNPDARHPMGGLAPAFVQNGTGGVILVVGAKKAALGVVLAVLAEE